MVWNRLSTVAGLLVCALIAPAAPAAAQAAAQGTATGTATASGKWKGVLETPAQALDIEVDLKDGAAGWTGAITIPAQNLKGFALTSISVQGAAVSFVIPNVPGEPTFKGTLSADGTTIAGDFSQGPGVIPFKLTRAGEAVLPPPPAKSTAITKEVEGTWSGTLQARDRSLRLNLKLAAGADGATGTLISVDQGNAEVPIASIVQTGTHLELKLPSISGSYSGDLKDGKLVGTWSQGPGTMPLEFTRVP